MNTGRVLFYVQHLLGVGHVKRAEILVRAMVEAGLQVTVIQGGFDVPGVAFAGADLIKLPPARSADASFSAIVDENDAPISDTWKTLRAQMLIDAFDDAKPNIVLVELYPFGRRAFEFELEPLLTHCHSFESRPWVICSLRDVLVKKTKPGRDIEIANQILRHFDHVLVHGDPNFISLAETFSETNRIAENLIYTGLVTDLVHTQTRQKRDCEVVISGGGGAVAEDLFTASLRALPDTPARNWTWRFLCGPNFSEIAVNKLRIDAPGNAVFEPNRPNFRELLSRSMLSISQAGYNTVMDIISTDIPAVLIPFADGAESEQRLRAQRLAELGYIVCVDSLSFNIKELSKAISKTLEYPTKPNLSLNMGGSLNSANFLRELSAKPPTSPIC